MAGYKGGTFCGQFLALVFNGTSIPGIAQNISSSPLTNFYVALHTADPGAGVGGSGNQSTNEVTYTSYARVAIARTTGGWTLNGASIDPVSNILWPSPTGSAGQTATFFSVGTAATGTGQILWAGPITPTQVITLSQPPTLTTATLISEA